MYPGDGQPQPNWQQQQNWQQPSYQGLGYYQQPGGPPPPRKRANLAMILSIVALVVIIGAVVAIVLITREGDDEAQPQTPPATSEPSTKAPPRSTTQRPTSRSAEPLQPRNPGWTVIKNDKASLIYEVPPAWTPVPAGTLTSKTMPTVSLSAPATLTDYQCEGKGYSRGGLGGGKIAKSSTAQVATDIAKALGAEFYSSGTATVTATEPKPVTVKSVDGDSVNASQVDAVITTTGNACLATKGKVSVLVLEGASEYQFFVVNGDLEGGPAAPPAPAEADLQKIVESARSF